MLQVEIRKAGYEIIYFDQFAISSKYNGFQSWSKRGQKGYIVQDINSFSMFFVIAFSDQNIYGMKGSKVAMNSEYTKEFISQVIEARK